MRIHGRVFDGAGEPVPDALVEISAPGRDRSAAATRATAASSWPRSSRERVDDQAPHLAVSVFARGLLKRVVTRMYFPDEAEANAADPVLSGVDEGRRSTLVAVPEPDGSLRFDIQLQGPDETVFFAL